MTKTNSKYTVIAIYGGSALGENAISTIDGTPGYLHLHIIRKDILNDLPILDGIPPSANTQKTQTIYQWGAPSDKILGTRGPIVGINEIIRHGNIGIGSAAIGGKKKETSEETSSFVGGGEVFVIPCMQGLKAFRITKGQGVFPLKLDDNCWTCEVTNNQDARVMAIEEENRDISSRQELLNILRKSHGQNEDMPFVARFDAYFEKEHLAIGLRPSDTVDQRDTTLFDAALEDPVGGHLLGDSDSPGDQINKHTGNAPTNGAKLSLTLEGVISISPIKNRLIGLKTNPREFRAPLLKEQLIESLKSDENHRSIVINGGGIAGVTTALKLAKLGIPCTIIDQREKLLSETSGCTPARVGHGFHYGHDETGITYFRNSVTFLKEYCSDLEKRKRFIISVSETNPELDYGLYFIRKDSQIPARELLSTYEGIREEYKRLIELDPSNKIFGEVDNFFKELDLEDYKDIVDISKMETVIRTQERLLNWPEFSAHLLQELDSYQQQGLISVMNQEEVTKIEYDDETKNNNFKITTKSGKTITASNVVNSTWSSMEELDVTLFPEAASEERTNRAKGIASIALPEHKHDIPSIFTGVGPFTMFSNEGKGKGKLTYAPVTNMLDYVIAEFKKEDESTFDLELREIYSQWKTNGEITAEEGDFYAPITDTMGCSIDQAIEEFKKEDESTFNLELRDKIQKWCNSGEIAVEKALRRTENPELWRDIERQLSTPLLYKRWLAHGLNEKETSFFGRKILEGVVEAYPALAGSSVTKVACGIVKSNGEVDIRKSNSKFHERSDHGLKQRQIGFNDFNGVKLFYVENQSRNVVENIVSDIRLSHLIEKEVIVNSGAKDTPKAKSLGYYARRYGSEKTLNRGDFSSLKERSNTDVAIQATTSYMQDALGSMLNLYLKEPQLTLNLFTPFVSNIIRSIGDATKTIIDSAESDICNEQKMGEWQKNIEASLSEKGFPELFTVFSIIDLEGKIIFDGKLGEITEEMRKEHDIPSLITRDYVQKMLQDKDTKFTCGAPVIGSTSGDFMIPVGIKLNDNLCLTFGMNVAELMRVLPKQVDRESIR